MHALTRLPLPLGTALALLAVAGNSLLCRAALRDTATDAATFTALRLAAGAVALLVLVRLRDRHPRAAWAAGSWASAAALAAYAAAFSWAYRGLSTGTGALLLFGSVQTTMLTVAHLRGDRLRGAQWPGFLAALAGLGVLVAPGVTAPPPAASLAMVGAGMAWAVYTLRGRGQGDALAVTSGNFARAALPAALLWLASALAVAAVGHPLAVPGWSAWHPQVDAPGLALALASGALTSGLGYAIWYAVLPRLRVTVAASLQLAVPVIAALLGVGLLGEALGWRLLLGAVMVVGGLGLVIRRPGPR